MPCRVRITNNTMKMIQLRYPVSRIRHKHFFYFAQQMKWCSQVNAPKIIIVKQQMKTFFRRTSIKRFDKYIIAYSMKPNCVLTIEMEKTSRNNINDLDLYNKNLLVTFIVQFDIQLLNIFKMYKNK